MELNQINIEYSALKARLAQDKFVIDGYKSAINNFSQKKVIEQGKLADAQLRGDTTAENDAKKEIAKIDKEISDLQRKVESKKQELSAIRQSLNEKIKTITQDPKMQQHFNDVMKVRCERKISKLEKDKKEKAEEYKRLGARYKSITNLETLLQSHATLTNNFKGMILAQKQIDDLNAKLVATPGDPMLTTQLADATNKLNTNKSNLLNYIRKHKIDIKETDIDSIIKNATVVTKNMTDASGKTVKVLDVDVDKTFKKEKEDMLKKAKDIKKDIEKTNNDIEVAKSMTTSKKETQASNLKWYQFAKRFRNWKQRRHQKAIAEPLTENGRDDADAFANSLRYAVVKDSMARIENQNQKTAQREVNARKAEEHEPGQ